MSFRIRRSASLEPRLEIMPLIDVVFLLLTFFIYAMVMMIRAQILPVQLPALAAGEPAQNVDAVSITLNRRGELFVDGQSVELGGVVAAVQEIIRETPDARVYVAADIEGEADRLPLFIDLVNRLRASGLDEFFIVGRPPDEGEDP